MPSATYYILPEGKFIAKVAKAGCSSVALAIIQNKRPDLWTKLQNAAFPAGRNYTNTILQSWVPVTKHPTGPVLQLVRDPVQRFPSSMAQLGLTDVDDTLTKLEQGDADIAGDFHFYPQNNYAIGAAGQTLTLYRFPDQLPQFCTGVGFTYPLPTINESAPGTKPTLTDAQIARVQAYYAGDVSLYNSIPA